MMKALVKKMVKGKGKEKLLEMDSGKEQVMANWMEKERKKEKERMMELVKVR
jgi:hypothetical protein